MTSGDSVIMPALLALEGVIVRQQNLSRNQFLSRLSAPIVRYMLAVSVTTVTTIVLLQSSTNPIIGQPAPPGPPDFGREVLLTSGHISVFVLTVSLWTWALVTRMPLRRALTLTLIFAFSYSILTEWGQSFVPDRTASVYDLIVNWTSASVTAWVIWRSRRDAHAPEHPD